MQTGKGRHADYRLLKIQKRGEPKSRLGSGVFCISKRAPGSNVAYKEPNGRDMALCPAAWGSSGHASDEAHSRVAVVGVCAVAQARACVRGGGK